MIIVWTFLTTRQPTTNSETEKLAGLFSVEAFLKMDILLWMLANKMKNFSFARTSTWIEYMEK